MHNNISQHDFVLYVYEVHRIARERERKALTNMMIAVAHQRTSVARPPWWSSGPTWLNSASHQRRHASCGNARAKCGKFIIRVT